MATMAWMKRYRKQLKWYSETVSITSRSIVGSRVNLDRTLTEEEIHLLTEDAGLTVHYYSYTIQLLAWCAC